MTAPTINDSRFDLLAVVTHSWLIEIACEICLREAAAGRQVGFVFLDVVNADEFPLDTALRAQIYAAQRRVRLPSVRAVERILRMRGVTIIPGGSMRSRADLSCAENGLNSIDALRSFRVDGAALGIGVVSSVIRQCGGIDPDFETNRGLIDRMLTSAYQTFQLTQQLIKQFRPATVLVFNGRLAGAKAVSEAARLSGVETMYYERGGSPERFYFSSRPPQSSENGRELLRRSWDGAGSDRDTIAAAYFSPGRGGALLRDTEFVGDQVRGHELAATGRRRIVYYVSSVDEYAAVEDGVEHPLFDSQRAAVEWLASWVAPRPDTELVIRLHPRMQRLSAREQMWWDSFAATNVIVLPADSPVDSYALAVSADRVVCYHSSLGVEATYLGKVSILIGDANYRGLDCVYEPATVIELEHLLGEDPLPPKPRGHCLPFGYYQMNQGEKFRYFQPISDRSGTFFGEPVAPESSPLIDRVKLKIVTTLGAAIYKLARSNR